MYLQAVGAGCSDPAALLIAAARHHNEQDAKCETILDSIRLRAAPGHTRAPPRHERSDSALTDDTNDDGDAVLGEAIRDCVEGAGWVHGIASQQALLRAAIYGRSNAPAAADVALIPQCALHCRVVNSLRTASAVRTRSHHMRLPAGVGLELCDGVLEKFAARGV